MAKHSKKKKSFRKGKSAKTAKASKSGQPGDDNSIVIETDREFAPFRKLPIELRRMIWKYATPKQRVIQIMSDGYTQEILEGHSTTHLYIWKAKASYTTVPALLHVHQESRIIGEETYSKVFSQQLGGRAIWFNFASDILYFEDSQALLHFHGGHANSICLSCVCSGSLVKNHGFGFNMEDTHSLVRYVIMGFIRGSYGWVGETLKRFQNLKTLYIEDSVTRQRVYRTVFKVMAGYDPFDEATDHRSVELGKLPGVYCADRKGIKRMLKKLKVSNFESSLASYGLPADRRDRGDHFPGNERVMAE
jgi:2EXR family